MNVKAITEHSLLTLRGEEVVLFLIKPTNVSVLSRVSLTARVNALMNVLKGFAEIEFLCLNSRESFEHNKRFLSRRMEEEELVPVRSLLEQDVRHLDEIQSRTAAAREFMLIIRPRNIGRRELYPYLSRLEKMIRDQQFSVRRAGYDDIKRILAVYFSNDVISEGYDDFDGQRWLMKDGRSDYKAASIMEEAQVLQTFLDLIAPAAVKFEPDRYIMGNTWRCVWAVRGYPTSTEEQAILQRLGERAGVTLHIYTRLVSPSEEGKIIQAADKANRFRGSGNDIRQIVEAQSNLEDVSSMVRTAHRTREPFFHTAVYIELIAQSEQEFQELRTGVESDLNRAKISIDRLSLCQQEGFLSVMPSGWNAFGEQYERMLPASSVANLYPFAYSGKIDPNGFYLGYDKYGSSIIVDFDRRDADKSNANIIVLGNSGQGKSFLVKLIICNLLESGKRVICIDPDGEYRALTEALGGYYLDLKGGGYMLNLLEPKRWDSSEAEKDDMPQRSSHLSQHISFLRDAFRSYKPEMSMEQADTIEIILEKLYAQWGISNDTDFAALAPTDYPVLSDLHELMQRERLSMEGKNELYTADMLRDTAKAIYSICVGPDSIYFNGHTNIPSKRFLTFGLKDIMGCGQDVRNLMLFNLLAYTNHELLGVGNTAAIYEEFHSFTNNEAAVNLICNAMKRVRKKESQVIIASQNLEDFMRPGVAEITKPLFYIPTHQFLFYPGSVTPKDFMEMLQLDEAEYNLIRNPQTGVCLMKCGSERYNLVVRAPEYKQKLYGTGGGR